MCGSSPGCGTFTVFVAIFVGVRIQIDLNPVSPFQLLPRSPTGKLFHGGNHTVRCKFVGRRWVGISKPKAAIHPGEQRVR